MWQNQANFHERNIVFAHGMIDQWKFNIFIFNRKELAIYLEENDQIIAQTEKQRIMNRRIFEKQ